MNILIVEDEKLAFERLERLVRNSGISIDTVQHSPSIKESISLIKNQKFDLAFFDIELSDGLSFEILENVEIQFPIIFTTAYNQYTLKAFKHNSIDYLIKPVDKNELQTALNKFEKYWNKSENVVVHQNDILSQFKSLVQDNYKKRFTIKIGEHIRMVQTKDIALIYSQNKGTYLRTNRDFLIDDSLETIYSRISPKQFFRISRQYVVALDHIKDIIAYTNSRLKIVLDSEFEQDLIVSREKVKGFKTWLEGE